MQFLLPQANSGAAERPRQAGEQFRPGYLLIRPCPGREADLDRVHAREGASLTRRFRRTDNLQLIRLPPGTDLNAAGQRYQESGHVELAEPDYWVRAALTPNDPYFLAGTLWAMENSGFNGGWLGADIDAARAWEAGTSAGGVIVAVVDSGIRHSHEDLAPNLWVNPGEIPDNDIDDEGNGVIDDIHGFNAIDGSGAPVDDLGHGTKVAGAIGAAGNNALGVTGVAWRIQLMDCKFLDHEGYGSISGLIRCIDYARANGARIINASFVTSSRSAALESALIGCRDDGILVVAAAGNGGTDNDLTPWYPASYTLDNIVSVTATTRTDGFANYNYGLVSVDLAAPGREIISTAFNSDASYGYEHGTSIAAPIVSGAFSLLLTAHPGETHQQLIRRLLSNTDPLPSLAGKCASGGRLNLYRALIPASIHPPMLWCVDNKAGTMELEIIGEPFQTYIIQVSGDLAAWTSVSTNIAPASGILRWSDPEAPAQQHFYRTAQ